MSKIVHTQEIDINGERVSVIIRRGPLFKKPALYEWSAEADYHGKRVSVCDYSADWDILISLMKNRLQTLRDSEKLPLQK
jgi:hypothetical protein